MVRNSQSVVMDSVKRASVPDRTTVHLCPQQPDVLSFLYFSGKLDWTQGTFILKGLER